MANNKTVNGIIRFRRDTAANWNTHKDYIPYEGEPCFEIDTNILKIGNGVDTYESLDGITSMPSVDGKSIIVDDKVLKLLGFDEAPIGAHAIKDTNGNINWEIPSTEVTDNLSERIDNNDNEITSIKSDIQNLKNTDGDLSNDKINDNLNTLYMGANIPRSIDNKIESYINDSQLINNIYLNGKSLPQNNHSVDIPLGAGLKSSDEIVIKNDGTVGISSTFNTVVTDASYKSTKNENDISSIKAQIGSQSVATQIDDALDKFASRISDDGVVNTYKELIDYAAQHSAEIVSLIGMITALQGTVDTNTSDILSLNDKVGPTSVQSQISEAMKNIDISGLSQIAKTGLINDATLASITDGSNRQYTMVIDDYGTLCVIRKIIEAFIYNEDDNSLDFNDLLQYISEDNTLYYPDIEYISEDNQIIFG